MLKITSGTGDRMGRTLKLEGKVVGPWVGELSRICLSDSPLQLDLSCVTFIDEDGLKLLRELIDRGIRIVSCSGLVAEFLQEERR